MDLPTQPAGTPLSGPPPGRRATVIAFRFLLISAGYWLAAHAAFNLASVDRNVALIWPSAGIALAALIRWGAGYGLAVFAGAFAFSMNTGMDPTVAALMGLGNSLGPTLAAALLRWPIGFRASFERYRDLGWFLLLGVVLLPATAATLGPLGLVLSGNLPSQDLVTRIGLWWFGDSTGVVIVAPVLLASPRVWWSWLRQERRGLETIAALVTLTLMACVVLLTDFGRRAPTAIVFVAVLWAAIRCGRFGGALAMLIFAGFVTYTASRGFETASASPVPPGVWPLLGLASLIVLLISGLISERDASVARARANEELARSAVDDAAEAIIVFDECGRILEANRITVERLGYERAELLRMSLADLAPPDEAARVAATIRDIADGRRTVTEWRVRHRDGSPIDVELSAQMLSDGRLEAVARDVTDRRLAADALRASEARLRTIFETSPDCVKIIGAAGELIDMNPAGLAMIEAASIDDVRGNHVTGLIVPEHRDRYHALAQAALAGRVAHAEFEIVGLRGTRRWMQSTAAPLPDDSGRPAAVLAVTRDITSARRADEARRQLSERNEALVAALGDAVYEWDHSTGAMRWGGSAQAMLGWSPAEMGGSWDDWLRRVHAEDVPRVRRAMEDALRVRSPFEAEYRVRDRDGVWVWIQDRAVLRGPAGLEPARMIGVIRDISALRRAEAEQQAGQRFVERVTGVLPVMVYVWDLQRQENVFINRAVASSLGFEADDVRADPTLLHRMMDPDDRNRFASHLARFDASIADDDVLEFEYRMRHKDGTWRHFVSRDSVFARDDAGLPSQIVGSALDVTDRLQAQQRIRQLAAFPELNPAAVFELSASGFPTYWNAAAESMATTTPGGHLAALLPDGVAGIVRECLASGRERSRVEHVRGSRTLACSFFPIKSLDVVHCYVIDVSDHVEMRSQLEQAQRMESIGQLAGGVAHDFNNLLQVITGYSVLAQDTTLGPDERDSSLDHVLTAAGRAAELTRQLLAFGRRQPLRVVDTDMNDLVSAVLRLARRLIGENISVDFVPGFELGNVRADHAQLEQVLLNLCINARDAMPGGGCITIRTENVVSDTRHEVRPWSRPGPYVLVTVSDTGHGMERAVLDRVFEPFFTTKPKERGTGLGLAVVYGIVKQHEGMIEVDSAPGVGTTFRVYLPVRERSTTAPTEPMRMRPPGGTETVLVAEDDDAVADLTRQVLERSGYRVLMARDGTEAIELFQRHLADVRLVILDLVMPKTGGVEAFVLIREIAPAVPILFASGYGGHAIPATFTDDLGAALLEKPFQPDTLLRRVRDALDHEGTPVPLARA